MEHAIGQRIILEDGRVAEVVLCTTLSCRGCVFANETCWDEKSNHGKCNGIHRTDHKNIIYKEVKEEE